MNGEHSIARLADDWIILWMWSPCGLTDERPSDKSTCDILQVMLGYHNNPKATADTISPDGWLNSGDIGYYNDRKEFYIVDRIKELIKVQGYQVSVFFNGRFPISNHNTQLSIALRYCRFSMKILSIIPVESHGE